MTSILNVRLHLIVIFVDLWSLPSNVAAKLFTGWEVASLEGGSIFSYAASEVLYQGTAQHAAHFYPPAGGRGGPGPRGDFPVGHQNGVVPAPNRGIQQPTRFGQPRNAAVRPRQQIPQRFANRSAAELRAANGLAPNGEYKLLSPTWKTLVTMALRIDRAAQPQPKQVLRLIMRETETFIREPVIHDQAIFIWGKVEQVTEAKDQLAKWEQDVRDSATAARTAAWHKEKAHDGRAEHREERENREKYLKNLRQEAEIKYPVEVVLLWPRELDIGEFESTNTEAIDQFRSQFSCRISFPGSNIEHTSVEHITIAAESPVDAASLKERMINLIKETISRRDQLSTANMVHIPDFDIYRDRVGLLDLDPKSGSYLPTLHGKPAADKGQLSKDRRQVQVNNHKKIKKTIDTAIKRLRVSQQHTRMRFVFGELGFVFFQKPAAGAETYSFEDFYTMVTKERIKLTLNGLPIRQGEVTDLPDVLEQMDAFSDPTEYYAAFFDFPGTTSSSTLRLETVFTPMGADETENREKRWVEISDAVSKLQASHLNFDRPDYQVTIDAFPLGIDQLRKAQIQAFQANITMERPPDGIKSTPRRRVKHPQERGLQFVSELTLLKYRFKNTDGVFELRRKDTYDLRPGKENNSPFETRWHALYYYPEWDNLMGEFANIRPGEDVKWAKSVATFFPESGDQWTALPMGFKNFMNEVEEIQNLLSEAISRLANRKGPGRATEHGHTNGA
ncbi:hypothetical protein A1O7_08463 [Cladophialophora yegresii CBS 114405]|uniref:DUF7905 domain-containing protein n=1 Tax=Cladophialophora yegresii CBS 114405 TaxID=1182544 RepID=W9VR92_9EURO|nr:uncharacterized protein A1O7_08463 [Cladophialophora yegresii CBS 114405]EXJ55535.1 hypothetical protein A1O7_08463 [Cladophialophora yegresii CBS 114405]